MNPADPESISIARLILAFSVVFALLVGLGFGLKYIKTRGLTLPGMIPRTAQRLQIMESLPLDVQRRLVIVRCDDAEHLLLLGHDRDIVVDIHLKENRSSSGSKVPYDDLQKTTL